MCSLCTIQSREAYSVFMETPSQLHLPNIRASRVECHAWHVHLIEAYLSQSSSSAPRSSAPDSSVNLARHSSSSADSHWLSPALASSMRACLAAGCEEVEGSLSPLAPELRLRAAAARSWMLCPFALHASMLGAGELCRGKATALWCEVFEEKVTGIHSM